MHHRLLLAALLWFSSLHATEFLPATSEGLTIEGRSLRQNESLILGHPGSTVHLRFTGTCLTILATTQSQELYLDVLVDDQAPRFLHLQREMNGLCLAEGLPCGEHRISLIKRGETHVGKLILKGFQTDGHFLPPPSLPLKRLLCIGDSFTCGQGTTVRGNGPMDPEKAKRQNGRLAYPYLLSRSLGFQLQIVGCAGRGLVYDWQGLSSGIFPREYYELVFPEADSPRWEASNYPPDIIIICIGSNDFDQRIPEQTSYLSEYESWLKKVRSDAPKAHIVLMNSPILQDLAGQAPKRSILLAYLRQLIAHLQDPEIEVFEIPVYTVIPGDWHPDALAHEDIAKRLQKHLATKR